MDFANLPRALLALMLAALGCGDASEHCIALTSSALFGADVGSPLDSDSAASVVALTISSRSAQDGTRAASAPELCSGVLISSRQVLTAAHCARQAPAGQVRVQLGANTSTAGDDACAAPRRDLAVSGLTRHPDFDVMLVTLAQAVEDLVPARLSTEPVDPSARVIIAGYGLTEAGSAGERRFLETRIQPSVAAGSGIWVDSGPSRGACGGDSGGPLFIETPTGWQLAGVLSAGSAFCVGIDRFVAIEAIEPWLTTHVVGTAAVATPRAS